MTDVITYVGIDAHKKELRVAMLVGHALTPVQWSLPNQPAAVARLVRKRERESAGSIQCCCEAGPCGYALQRQLPRGPVRCQVIAPALIPWKPGERIKTDRRDAPTLAELLRAGLLTEVRPPTPAEEAARDLVRARDDAREDVQRCRHRLGELLLRRGLHFAGRETDRRDAFHQFAVAGPWSGGRSASRTNVDGRTVSPAVPKPVAKQRAARGLPTKKCRLDRKNWPVVSSIRAIS